MKHIAHINTPAAVARIRQMDTMSKISTLIILLPLLMLPLHLAAWIVAHTPGHLYGVYHFISYQYSAFVVISILLSVLLLVGRLAGRMQT